MSAQLLPITCIAATLNPYFYSAHNRTSPNFEIRLFVRWCGAVYLFLLFVRWYFAGSGWHWWYVVQFRLPEDDNHPQPKRMLHIREREKKGAVVIPDAVKMGKSEQQDVLEEGQSGVSEAHRYL
ncbi:uncharacterized protein LOC106771775 [Vigna radiata var. radiata]|uniref:Uncharacterized protein LOC106771775 n=1 Tax=Vigna radiata var. radiata TaxID=3916 RepID=A0A3Q0FES1_VIGRR|nr:uncharacterized protein LOC106771775 [Vigna radiata var. radiata]